MLHPLEQVGDQQNPLADPPALASRQAPQLGRSRFAAKEICRHRPSPKTWYVRLITLPHLGITGSRYNDPFEYVRDDALNRNRLIVTQADGVRIGTQRRSELGERRADDR